MFRALVLEEADGKVSSSIQELDEASLPDGDVTVAIDYSTLNYKDGMILGGIGRMVRNYPHIGGIDFAGTVEESAHHDYHAGDKVILTGWRVGEAHWGGYSQKSRVKGDWLVHLPENLSTRQAMALGTAGFTAMLSVQALEDHGLGVEDGEVLVTGAAGGVGFSRRGRSCGSGLFRHRVDGEGGDPRISRITRRFEHHRQKRTRRTHETPAR